MFQWLRKLTGKAANMTAIPPGLPLHKFTDYESYLAAANRKVWASWKACDLTAKVVMDTPFAVLDPRGERMENPPEDLARLLRYPSADETFSDLVYLTVMHLKQTGNAFWYKSEARQDGSRPKEILSLNPKRMKIIPGKDRKVAGYALTITSGRVSEIPFEPEEIMHFRVPHPNNDYWGLGDLEASEELFNSTINRGEWDKQFWKNGASPSGLLTTKQIVTDQKEFDRIKAKWQREYGGLENSGRTAFLAGDWTYQQLGLTAVEMQDMEKAKVSVEYIATAHGVPLSVLGLRDAANYATAEIDDMRFRRYTVKPLVKIIQDTVNTDLAAGWGLAVEWEIAGLIPISHVMASYTPLFDRGGMTINELRAKAGLAQDKDNPLWEQTFINAGLLPLALAGITDFGQTAQQAQAAVNRFIDSKLTAN